MTPKSIAFIRTFLIFTIVFVATEIIVPGEDFAFKQAPVATFMSIVFLGLVIGEKLKEATEKLYTDHISEKERAEYYAKKEKKRIKNWKSLWMILSNIKPLSEEGIIELDHDYDGIKELDNDLPPWWLYGFYATIVFALAYLGYYEVFGGPSQKEEYHEDVVIAQKEIEAYKKNVKPINFESLANDANTMSKGKKLFKQNCAVCHMVDGRGGIGPNLTDEYWILGGGIKNIYNTISEGGRDGKGMIAWKNSLSVEKTQQVSNYVWSLQGSKPAKAKAPEGDKWVE
jgi:cytochrome c oxidase cbb3-type subunit 3